MSGMTQHPCGMWLDVRGLPECGKPATLGTPAETGGLIPICDDCIARTGTKRKYLSPLPTVTNV